MQGLYQNLRCYIMRKADLVLNIYRINDRRGCLVAVTKGKKPLKILNIPEPLHFVGWMKQLSMAVNTGAEQNCKYDLNEIGYAERQLKCRFAGGVVSLEIWFKHLVRLQWKGTAYEFADAVNWMIARLPKFFRRK